MTATKNQDVPTLLYGTAWKEEKTADLTFMALETGFRAIDTANQRKHYFEEGVGQGIKRFLDLKSMERKDLFLQTKFTFAGGQDHRLPYNANTPIAQQVVDSFASSLQHLNTDYLDSYVLHGPINSFGFSNEDLEAWSAMEKLLHEKQTRHLGISNVSMEQLKTLCKKVVVKPRFVQNRCFARTGWDKEVREFCKGEGILYQGFSVLTANSRELSSSSEIVNMAQKYEKTVAQVVFRFCHQLGMIFLTGTTNREHMRQDLNIYDFELSPAEIAYIENVSIEL
jgi:diketogulonate reductase-like aldo/keto reductase